MYVNPINVLNLLLGIFQAMNIPESPINEAEKELAENLRQILISSMDEINTVEAIEEETLAFEEEFKDYEAKAVEDDTWFKDEQVNDACSEDQDELSYDYKKKAVDFWRSGKKKEF